MKMLTFCVKITCSQFITNIYHKKSEGSIEYPFPQMKIFKAFGMLMILKIKDNKKTRQINECKILTLCASAIASAQSLSGSSFKIRSHKYCFASSYLQDWNFMLAFTWLSYKFYFYQTIRFPKGFLLSQNKRQFKKCYQ